MKYLTPIITLTLVVLSLIGAYFYYKPKPQEQPKIEVVMPQIRTPQTPEVKPLYVNPKYECKGVCK